MNNETERLAKYRKLSDLASEVGDVMHEIVSLQARFMKACEVATGIKEGDRVELISVPKIDTRDGWWCYRETFRPRALGTAKHVSFNEYYGYFSVAVEWDVQRWTENDVVHEGPGDGYFYMNAKNLRAYTSEVDG